MWGGAENERAEGDEGGRQEEVRRDFLRLSSCTYLAYSVELIGLVAMVI